MLDLPSLIRLIIFIPLLLVLPGSALMAWLPVPSQPDARPSSWVEGLWRVVMASLVLSGWVAQLLAERGVFRLRIFLLIVIGGSLAAWAGLLIRRRDNLRLSINDLRLSSRLAIIPLVIFGLALALNARTHETILGAADAGVYVSRAAYMVRTGSLVVRESTLASLPSDQADQLLQFTAEMPDIPLRFPGFYTVDVDEGVSLPQFFPLFPAWLAIFYALGGVWASLWALPLLGALGVLSVYFAGRWTLGPWPAAIGAFGLAVLAPQIWFSRYTTTETLTQALLWAGVMAFTAYVRTGAPARLGVLAGLALGGVLLTRIDTPFLLALPAGLVVWGLVRRPERAWLARLMAMLRQYGAFLLPMTLLTIHAGAYALVFAYPYVEGTSGILAMREVGLVIALAVGLALAALGVLVVRGRRGLASLQVATAMVGSVHPHPPPPSPIQGEGGQRLPSPLSFPSREGGRRSPHPPTSSPMQGEGGKRQSGELTPLMLARGGLALGILLLGLWAYFIRPLGDETQTYSTWYAGTIIISKHLSLVQLGWYLSPVGVFLALVGAALVAYRAPASRVWLLLAVGLLFSVLYLAHPLNNTRHIYVMRRYIPAVLPAFVLCVGYALAWVAGATADSRRRTVVIRGGMAVLMAAMALVGVLPVTARIIGQAEQGGTVEQMARLADRFEPNAVVLFRDPDVIGNGAVLGTPLQFIHGRDTFVVQGQIEGARMAAMIQSWQAAGRPVYLALSDGGVWPTLPTVTLTPLGRWTLDTHILEAPFDRPPSVWLPHQPSVELFRFGP